ncbi:hypothetical protein DFH06DRAFT_925286, partial [Mycena polygramma]
HRNRYNCSCNECTTTRTECPECPNPHKCYVKARALLNSLEDKWNPLLVQPEDYEDGPQDPPQLSGSEVLFNPKITTKGTLANAFRIFTEG